MRTIDKTLCITALSLIFTGCAGPDKAVSPQKERIAGYHDPVTGLLFDQKTGLPLPAQHAFMNCQASDFYLSHLQFRLMHARNREGEDDEKTREVRTNVEKYTRACVQHLASRMIDVFPCRFNSKAHAVIDKRTGMPPPDTETCEPGPYARRLDDLRNGAYTPPDGKFARDPLSITRPRP
jgi:hypothetical protein